MNCARPACVRACVRARPHFDMSRLAVVRDFLSILEKGVDVVDIYFRVLKTIDEEIFAFDEKRTPEEVKHNMIIVRLRLPLPSIVARIANARLFSVHRKTQCARVIRSRISSMLCSSMHYCSRRSGIASASLLSPLSEF
jgi:hypothetical protein